jgi:hypothetical protein
MKILNNVDEAVQKGVTVFLKFSLLMVGKGPAWDCNTNLDSPPSITVEVNQKIYNALASLIPGVT